MTHGASPAVKRARATTSVHAESFTHWAFAPYRQWLAAFQMHQRLPDLEQLNWLLGPSAGMRFVVQRQDMKYDECIDLRREVPTRPGHWHDFMNALVWATFPHSKRALHARQRPLVAAQRGPRCAEADALAILDEAGVLGCAEGPLVFGHAVLEALALGTPVVPTRGMHLEWLSRHDLSALDTAFAERLTRDTFVSPQHLARVLIEPNHLSDREETR
jgi:hypothetical protein